MIKLKKKHNKHKNYNPELYKSIVMKKLYNFKKK